MKPMSINRFNFFALSLTFLLIALLNTSQAHASYRFVVYADSRAPRNVLIPFNQQVLGYITSEVANLNPRPSFALFIGDMVNRAVDTTYTHNNLNDWKVFMQTLLGDIPLYTAVGNTDLYGNTGWTEYPLQAVYQETFNYLPNNGPKDYKKLAYSFEYGKGDERSLFVVLDSFGFFDSQGTPVNFDNGFDEEQLAWFNKVACKSDANHKFALSHGPAFSIEGFPVQDSVRRAWDIMLENDFSMFYCGHEHIYSRWTIDKTVYPQAIHKMIQTIVGSAGATPDPITNVKVNVQKAHAYSGYTYVVVDVKGDTIIQRAYAVVPDGLGGFTTQNLDNVIIR